MVEWQDWALGAGVVIFVLEALFAAIAGNNIGFLYAVIALVCVYYIGVRAQRRRKAKAAATQADKASPP